MERGSKKGKNSISRVLGLRTAKMYLYFDWDVRQSIWRFIHKENSSTLIGCFGPRGFVEPSWWFVWCRFEGVSNCWKVGVSKPRDIAWSILLISSPSKAPLPWWSWWKGGAEGGTGSSGRDTSNNDTWWTSLLWKRAFLLVKWEWTICSNSEKGIKSPKDCPKPKSNEMSTR